MAITLKEAIAKALVFAREALGDERTSDPRVEEVESTTSDTGAAAWRITISMRAAPPAEDVATPGLADLASLFKLRREYKTFTVLKDTGEVESMKIRQLA